MIGASPASPRGKSILKGTEWGSFHRRRQLGKDRRTAGREHTAGDPGRQDSDALSAAPTANLMAGKELKVVLCIELCISNS